MAERFDKFLFSQKWAKIVHALLSSDNGYSLRELASLSDISLGGVQDVLRRLKESEIVCTRSEKNRVIYSLTLDNVERNLLEKLFRYQTNKLLQERSNIFSKRYPYAVAWIDETLAVIRDGKKLAKQRQGDTT